MFELTYFQSVSELTHTFVIQNSGNAQPSYVGSLIDAFGGTPDDQEREAITWSAFSFFSGGIDTVSLN